MKKINIPLPVDINGQDFTLLMFARWLIDRDQVFNASGKAIRVAAKIEERIETAEKRLAGGGDAPALYLEDEQQTMLSRAAEAPSQGYPVTPGHRCVGFVDEIRDAEDVDKEPAEPGDPDAPTASETAN